MRQTVQKTTHFQATTIWGGWVPHLSACGLAPMAMAQLTDTPRAVTWKRCRNTRAVGRLLHCGLRSLVPGERPLSHQRTGDTRRLHPGARTRPLT